MNKRKTEQAKRTGSKGRKRVMKAMRGGRTVVVTPEKARLLELVRPQMPIRQRLQMEKMIAVIEAQNAAAGMAPLTPPETPPVIDLNATYKPGPSTVDLMEASALPPPPPPKVHTRERENARRRRQMGTDLFRQEYLS